MTDKIKYATARYFAEEVAQSAIVAYWTDDQVHDMHVQAAHSSFLNLAEQLGYTVELKK